jgi:hypothetical protein
LLLLGRLVGRLAVDGSCWGLAWDCEAVRGRTAPGSPAAARKAAGSTSRIRSRLASPEEPHAVSIAAVHAIAAPSEPARAADLAAEIGVH